MADLAAAWATASGVSEVAAVLVTASVAAVLVEVARTRSTTSAAVVTEVAATEEAATEEAATEEAGMAAVVMEADTGGLPPMAKQATAPVCPSPPWLPT